MRVDLPSGNWADLRDPETVTVRQRKQIMAASDGVDSPFLAGQKIAETLLGVAVEKWSFAELVTADGVLDGLTVVDYDALVDAMAPFRAVLFPDSQGKPTDPKAGAPASDD